MSQKLTKHKNSSQKMVFFPAGTPLDGSRANSKSYMNYTTPQNEAFKRRNLALGIRYFGDCSSQKQQKSVIEGREVRMNFYSCKHFALFVDSRGPSIMEPRKEKSEEVMIKFSRYECNSYL